MDLDGIWYAIDIYWFDEPVPIWSVFKGENQLSVILY